MFRLIITGLAAFAAIGLFAGCTDGGAGGGNKVTVTAVDYSFDTDDQISGGVVSFEVENGGSELHEFAFGKVAEGTTEEDIQAAIESGEEPEGLEDIGGVHIMTPGQRATLTRELEPGRYVFLCFVPNAEGQPHAALGMWKIITAEGTSDAELPEPDAVIEATDDAFAVPDISGGEQVLELRNTASAPREFILVSFEEGKTLADVDAWFEAGLEGDAPALFLGGMQTIAPGTSVFYEVDLEKDRTYTVISFTDAGEITQEFTPE
jgi:uncharacterized cupredoxin-like copper-binding protein